MSDGISRRVFLEGAAAGAASLSMLGAMAERAAAENVAPAPAKVRIGKVYFGKPRPGWPMASVDVEAERKRMEAELTRLQPALADVEFIDCGLVANEADLARAKEKLQGADGILFLQLTMGSGKIIQGLVETNVPMVVFAEPFSGHEWTTIATLQRKGKLIDCWATSKFDDVVPAIRPFRAIRRLKDAKVLHVSNVPADPAYVKKIKEKFGTEIQSLKLADLEAAYKAVDQKAAEAEAQRWVQAAEKVVEPTPEDVLKAARMALAVVEMVRAEQAAVITINCLGMGLPDLNMGYPCLGFCRLNDVGLGGICEADLKSTMTHLIFSYLVGRPGFVTDPCFDYSNNTILHAHCVSATKMLGPDGPTHPYFIRSHLEDNRSTVLQVKLPVGQKVSMAKLIGNDLMLFSTGDAIDSPLVDRGCRTKLTVRVEHPEKFMEGWTCGLHRVIFYGDHTRDLERFCRFAGVRLFREGSDDPHNVPGLDWPPGVRA
jgi:L-fucose isomerase-like protein